MLRFSNLSTQVGSARLFWKVFTFVAAICLGMLLDACLLSTDGGFSTSELVRLRAENMHLKMEVARLRQGFVVDANSAAPVEHLDVGVGELTNEAKSRRLNVFVGPQFTDNAPTVTNPIAQRVNKVNHAWQKVRGVAYNTTGYNGSGIDSSLSFLEEIGEAKYRVANVRFVFVGMAWIIIVGTSVGLIKESFDCWVFPQYQALVVQTLVVLILSAIPPSVALLYTQGAFWLNLIEVFLEGHVLLSTSLWIPRILEEVVKKVRDTYSVLSDNQVQDDDGYSRLLEEHLHTDANFKIISFDIATLSEQSVFGIPGGFTLVVAMLLLYVVRPVTHICLRSGLFETVFSNPQHAFLLHGIFDACTFGCAVLVVREGGRLLFKSIPLQFKTDRLNMYTVHALVLVQPLVAIALFSNTPDFILACQLNDLIHVCIIAVGCFFIVSNRVGDKDVMVYMAHVLKKIDKALERHKGKFRYKMYWILDPLLAYHSLRLPKTGWVAICGTIRTLLAVEHASHYHWPFDSESRDRPLMPYEKRTGDMVTRNTWRWVWADLYSSRVRSTTISVGLLCMFMTLLEFKEEFIDIGPMSSWWTLGLQLFFGLAIWFLSGLLLVGNNIFVSRRVFLSYSLLWQILLCIVFLANIRRFLDPSLDATTRMVEVLLGPQFRMWIHVVMAILCLLLMLAIFVRQNLGDRYSDFINIELSSLMYTSASLQNHFSRRFEHGDWVEVMYRNQDNWEDAQVKKDCEDGTYDVILRRHTQFGYVTNVLRKNLRQISTEEKEKSSSWGKQFARKHLLEFLKPLHKMPPVLLLSMTMSLVVVTAFSAVVADSTTRAFLVVHEMHDLAILGHNYIELNADCNETGYQLAKVVDNDRSGTVSHEELPFYSILRAIPSSLRASIINNRQMKLLWPSNSSKKLNYSQVAAMLCKVETAGRYRMQSTHGFGAIIKAAKHVNLTGQLLLNFYGGSISKKEVKDTLYQNIMVFGPQIATLAMNVIDVVYPKFDEDRSGAINGTEADVVALSLNFVVGRLPIILELIPCPKYMRTSNVTRPSQVRRLRSYLSPIARIIRLTDINFDNELDRQEWSMLVAALAWIPGLAWCQKVLMDTFDFFAGPYRSFQWKSIMKLAHAIDAVIATGVSLPTLIKEKNLTAKFFLPFLDENKDGMLVRSEMRGFEYFIYQSQMASRATAIMDRAFLVTDVNGDGMLAGIELDSHSFGDSVEDSMGQMALKEMEKSVLSTPANCKSVPHNTSNQSRAGSLLGRVLYGAAAHVGGVQAADKQDDEDSDESETWEETAARHLLTAAGVSSESDPAAAVGAPTNVYEVASRVKAQAKAAKEGITGTLDFFHTLQEAVSPDKGTILDAILEEIASWKVRQVVWLVTVGVLLANILSDVFVCVVCIRLATKYQSLMNSFAVGKPKDIDTIFQGHTYANSGKLRNSFSASSYLPGTMWFNIILSWLIFFIVFVTAWTAVVVGTLYSDVFIFYWGPYLTYISGSVVVMLLLRICIADGYLVHNGDITWPRLFTLIWMLLVVTNFVIGVNLAVVRLALIFQYTILSCCFLDYSLLPESLLRFDTGYFGFLSLAFTFYERHNPIKHAFNCILCPQTFRLHGPRVGKDLSDEKSYYVALSCEEFERARWLRAKKRFALALTLWRNPVLIHDRRKDFDDESSVDSTKSDVEPREDSLTNPRTLHAYRPW